MRKPEYAVAGSYREFMVWAREEKSRGSVSYLTKERAAELVDQGAAKGVLHRIGKWEESPALDDALRLEE